MTRSKRSSLAEAYHRARYDFTAFKYLIYPRYTHAPHLDLLDRALVQVARYVESGGKEGIGRLIVEMPPRHGKSVTTSRLFPAWYLGRNPDHRVMLVSYASSLTEKNSRYARSIIQSPRFQAVFPGLSLDPFSRAVDSWDVHQREGGLDAIGITGGATGKGAHILSVDDPIKSRAEAESQVYRDRIWDAFTDDLYTRLEPGGAIILIMTRWQQDDVVGRALRYMPGEWSRLHLPAIAEDNDQLGRPPGAALWPFRYPLAVLEERKRTLGPYAFTGLYQQSPTPSDGGLFKLEYFEPRRKEAPPLIQQVRYWDLAMSDRTSADYTVGLKYGLDADAHRYILDVARGQVDWGDLTDFLAQTIIADGPDVIQGIELQGYMSKAVATLNADPRLRGYSIFGYPKETDKFTNALPVAAKAAAGLVHVLDRHWTPDFLDEVCAFNKAAHDDQVDALAGAETMIGASDSALTGAMNDGGEGGYYGAY